MRPHPFTTRELRVLYDAALAIQPLARIVHRTDGDRDLQQAVDNLLDFIPTNLLDQWEEETA